MLHKFFPLRTATISKVSILNHSTSPSKIGRTAEVAPLCAKDQRASPFIRAEWVPQYKEPNATRLSSNGAIIALVSNVGRWRICSDSGGQYWTKLPGTYGTYFQSTYRHVSIETLPEKHETGIKEFAIKLGLASERCALMTHVNISMKLANLLAWMNTHNIRKKIMSLSKCFGLFVFGETALLVGKVGVVSIRIPSA